MRRVVGMVDVARHREVGDAFGVYHTVITRHGLGRRMATTARSFSGNIERKQLFGGCHPTSL